MLTDVLVMRRREIGGIWGGGGGVQKESKMVLSTERANAVLLKRGREGGKLRCSRLGKFYNDV